MLDRMLGVHVAADPEIANRFVTNRVNGRDESAKNGGRILALQLDASKFVQVPQETYPSGSLQSDQDAVEKEVAERGFKADPSILARYLVEARGEKKDDATRLAQDLVNGKTVKLRIENKPTDLAKFLRNYGGKPYNSADRQLIVDLARKSWQDEGWQGLKYVNTAPDEIAGVENKECYIVFDPKMLKSGFVKADFVEFARLYKFDPDEPRDDAGRWTSGSSASSLYEKSAKGVPTAQELIDASGAGTQDKINDIERRLGESNATNALVSDGGYKQPNGEYTSERKELHARIIDSILNNAAVVAAVPVKGAKPTVTLLGGRGGSGKSWLTGKQGPVDATKAIVINADDIQEHLPGYEGWNAGHYHDEAGEIGDEVEKVARQLGVNIVLDATMRTKKTAAAKVIAYEKAGYKVEGYYMFASPQVAAQRSIGRFLRAGRYVPTDYILKSTSNEKTFDDLKPAFSKWGLYDNNAAGGSPVLVAEGNNNEN